MRAIPISEVTDIGQSAVTCLNRRGIVTVAELLAADPGDIAYLLDSQTEAERVIRAARLAAGADDKRARAIPEPPAAGRHDAKPHAKAQRPPALAAAMALLDWTCADDVARIAATERLWTMALVLEHGGSEAEAAAALGQPTVAAGEAGAAAHLGEDAGALLDEVARIQGMPTAPIGRPREAWEIAVRRSSEPARRVCAASAVAALRAARALAAVEGDAVWARFQGGRDFALWYYRSLATALEAAGGSALISELNALLDAFEDRKVTTKRRAAA